MFLLMLFCVPYSASHPCLCFCRLSLLFFSSIENANTGAKVGKINWRYKVIKQNVDCQKLSLVQCSEQVTISINHNISFIWLLPFLRRTGLHSYFLFGEYNLIMHVLVCNFLSVVAGKSCCSDVAHLKLLNFVLSPSLCNSLSTAHHNRVQDASTAYMECHNQAAGIVYRNICTEYGMRALGSNGGRFQRWLSMTELRSCGTFRSRLLKWWWLTNQTLQRSTNR